jgi:lycopene beta-cyclase
VQHFEGWEIETSQPCFEPSCMDLMAFETHSQGLKFLYCLPTSPTRALVESTWISRAGLKVDYAAHLQQALQMRWAAGAYDIVFREQGALALWPGEQSEQPQYLQLGRAGGTLRPSTGYAFTASLWHAEQIAHSLKRQLQAGGSLQAWKAPRWSRSRVDDWMDRVLFRVLEQDWPSAPDYFVQMFERIPPMPLIRFLSGQASMVDRMAVMQALPMRPFVGAAFSTLRGAKL